MDACSHRIKRTSIGAGLRRRCARAPATLAAALSAVLVLASPAHADAATPAATLQLGSQTLTLCAHSPVSYCGRLSVPLDHDSPSGPQIEIAYRWYPATASPPGAGSGTVVPVEGGPGYPSIGSVEYSSFPGGAGGYRTMYGALLEHWNMLAVDNRGTGASTPLSCPALQSFTGPTGTSAFQQTAAECAAALNHRWRYPGGGWVHASDLFTSAAASEDLAAVIEALGVGRVSLYGDSYGSFFAQVFANHFPRLLRSVILDSTYQTRELDPWYRSSQAAMPGDFDAACSRVPACAGAAPGSAWERIGELAARLREEPISGVVPGAGGELEKVRMNLVGLVDLINDAAGVPMVYRGLDAAARALLEQGDPAPLLRLYAQRLAEDESYFGGPVREYSVELYLAVSCLDYPQLFSMSASPAVRAGELAAAEASLPSGTFAPFSTSEWLSQDQNTEAFSACLDWPSPTIAQAPVPGSGPLFPSTLPVLVLGGELDSWTPPAGVAEVLAQIGGHARFIELANSTHVVGEGDTGCGSRIIQAFVAHPQAIDTLDAACAAAIPPIRSVGVYASGLEEQPPLQAAAGNEASPSSLRLAAAALATAGDALARYRAIEAGLDHGLHGGTVTAGHDATLFTLSADRLLAGVAVSGTLRLSPAPIEADGDTVVATLTAGAPGLRRGSFRATWTTSGAGAIAQVEGSVGRERLAGTLPAP